MAFKVFLDTNIVVDFFLADRQGHIAAKKIFTHIENRNLRGYLSESVINTTSYLVRKTVTIKQFREDVKEMLTMVTVIPCTNKIIDTAYTRAQNDLEDAVLYQLTFESGLDYFVTSNLKDLKKLVQPSLPAIDSSKLAEMIQIKL